MKAVVKGIEALMELSGKIAAWMLGIVLLILVYEVVARFVFNSPTFWVYDTSYMVGGAAMALGGAYALKTRGHVRIDVIYERFSPKTQAVADIILSLIIFFPLMIIGFIKGYDFAMQSWVRQEQIMTGGYWKPYIYPLKAMIPLAFGLFILQGIADFIRNIYKFQGRDI